ncbi:alpha/beta fold hydrolase [Streptomyces sp. ISL-36]|uniref:alpha/beta hydrolase n=1 Tax=Streptomyces sp. ISL-36 TaxID=2819182 RepID=UPI001BEB7FB3|nr:alpha/beta hydrolase [Streptomyces sp. ISL-36]MBT2439534.1 alpha/beta fold hydrolase [Streptomyces sp. ISL-36]
MKRALRRRHALVLTLAVLGSLSACTAAPHPPVVPDVPEELRSFYGQKLMWTDCGELRCARLTVPMDYARPANGRTFVLPVVKAATADPARRIGSLVYNPGGPGESGVAFLKEDAADSFGAEVRGRFDVVSFDPRGVGGSVPALTCGDTGEEGTATPEGAAPENPLHPTTRADRAAVVAGARSTAAECARGSGGILRHVGTADAARDLDILRAALGDSRLSYLGWSYGTTLGTSYAEQFPHRVRAMVLDGATDPSLDWRGRVESQSAGFRRAVDDYATHCADVVGADACPGATPDEIRTLIDGLYARASREPLPADGNDAGVDERMLYDVVSMAMYTPEVQWEGLSRALAEAGRGDGTKIAALAEAEDGAPAEADGSGEGETADETDETGDTEEGSGTGADARDGTVAADNSYAASLAVDCLDVPHPRDAQPYWDALAPAEKAAGLYGTAGVVDSMTCMAWPTGTQKPHRVRAEGVPPVLVVGTTGDPATPYEEAKSLASQYPGGMLLTYEGLGHTAYGRAGACVTDAVDDYLVALKPVRPGATC